MLILTFRITDVIFGSIVYSLIKYENNKPDLKKKKKHFNNISDSWPKYDWFALYSVYDYNIDLIPDKTDLFEPDLAELGKVTLPDCLEPSNPEINTITTL